ncbi:hypothetical protein B0H17DRAFT_718552 [Mycena rosella]|uniref:Uncharacterized protein n=1 Tax=Mycena rosella TaxID=1033263 RepID=A0AAD7DA19_MYCRO|nr:hypothetical protein B0H17DRAFT_718552 [Mycena rosella]
MQTTGCISPPGRSAAYMACLRRGCLSRCPARFQQRRIVYIDRIRRPRLQAAILLHIDVRPPVLAAPPFAPYASDVLCCAVLVDIAGVCAGGSGDGWERCGCGGNAIRAIYFVRDGKGRRPGFFQALMRRAAAIRIRNTTVLGIHEHRVNAELYASVRADLDAVPVGGGTICSCSVHTVLSTTCFPASAGCLSAAGVWARESDTGSKPEYGGARRPSCGDEGRGRRGPWRFAGLLVGLYLVV